MQANTNIFNVFLSLSPYPPIALSNEFLKVKNKLSIKYYILYILL